MPDEQMIGLLKKSLKVGYKDFKEIGGHFVFVRFEALLCKFQLGKAIFGISILKSFGNQLFPTFNRKCLNNFIEASILILEPDYNEKSSQVQG